MDWTKLVHLGDLSLTLPAAAAMTAWLLAARAWRAAMWWSLLFGLGLGLVGVTKIAFLAWGASLPELDFKAISGHATGVTAVFPALFFLLLYRHSTQARGAGVVAGLCLGALVASMLVTAGEHTAAEALAGWAMGGAVALGCVRLAANAPSPPVLHGIACAALAFVGVAWMMQSAPVGWWMIKAALALSGKHLPCSWDSFC
jgi:hypothetical protein